MSRLNNTKVSSEYSDDSSANKKQNRRIVVVVLIILLLIGVGVGIYIQNSVLNRPHCDSEDDKETSEHNCKYVEYEYIEATCTEKGYRKYRCECGDEHQKTLDVLEHKYDVVDSKAASCTETGYAKYKCECGDEYQETLKMLDHNYEVVDSKVATCTETGYAKYKCECGDEYQETLKVLEHNYGVIDSKVASCTETGYAKHKCKCGDEYKKTTGAIGHDISEGRCKICGTAVFETLKFTGTGVSSIKNIDLPEGEYYIIGKYYGEGIFYADFYTSVSDRIGDVIANKIGVCEAISAVRGPIENGYINVDMADGDWEFKIVVCEEYDENELTRTLTYEGEGAKVIPNINLPNGDYYITCYYYGKSGFWVELYESVDDRIGSVLANKIGASESVYGFSGSVKQGYIDIGKADGKWKIVIEPCE